MLDEPQGPRNDGENDPDRNLIAAARRELEQLIEAERDTVPGAAPQPSSGEHDPGPPPDSFTGFEILREIHRGGQGVVYQALQKSTQRKVAIKVLREGPFAGPSDKARFEREVQVLGQLSHPNIVAIHDTGEAAGHTYFVMDYISGQPLDVYMASGDREIEETLRLFAKICGAVNAAHLRGVIHRDLKPSNVRLDDKGEPHVLDFGLAKVATNSEQAMTMTGQFVGSLPWASPEQAEGAPGKIDLRTDVYSLGVILYQMLTGKFPYEVVGNMRDVLDHIMTAEPARPSTVRRQVDDEVETLVLKCLSKERNRRYQTAGEVGRDVERYLRGEPIEAKRDSMGYLFRKQVRRYKLPATVAALFLVVITVGFVVSLAALDDAKKAQAATSSALDDERDARAAEMRARKLAEEEAANARAVALFFREMLESVNPYKGTSLVRPGETQSYDQPLSEISVADLLLKSVPRIRVAFEGRPHLEAEIRDSIGAALVGLGFFPEAEQQLRESIEARLRYGAGDDLDTARTRSSLAQLLNILYRARESREISEQAVSVMERELGPEHRETLRTRRVLGWALAYLGRAREGLDMLRDAHDRTVRNFGARDRDSLGAKISLSSALSGIGLPHEGEAMARELHRLWQETIGDGDLSTGPALANIAFALRRQGRYEEAKVAYQRHYEATRKATGVHVLAGRAMMELYAQLGLLRDYRGQVATCDEALEVCRTGHGEWSIPVFLWWRKKAEALLALGDLDAAEAILAETTAVAESQLAAGEVIYDGNKHPVYATVKLWLASQWSVLSKVRAAQRRPVDELAALSRNLEIIESAVRPDDAEIITARRMLAAAHGRAGDEDRRLAEARLVLASMRRSCERSDAGAWDFNRYAWELLVLAPDSLRSPQQGLEAATRAAALSARGNPLFLDTLAEAMVQTGDRDGAIEVAREALALFPACDSTARRPIVRRLLEGLLDRGDDEAAKEVVDRETTLLHDVYVETDPMLPVRLRQTGATLIELERAEWAEPWLRESVQLLRRLSPKIPSLLIEALEEHARCLEKLGRGPEAKPLKQEAETLKSARSND